MNRDPNIYGTDVHEFNPSRYLDSEGKIKPAIVDTKEESHSKLLGLSLRWGPEYTDCGFSDIWVRSSNLPWQVRPIRLYIDYVYISFQTYRK